MKSQSSSIFDFSSLTSTKNLHLLECSYPLASLHKGKKSYTVHFSKAIVLLAKINLIYTSHPTKSIQTRKISKTFIGYKLQTVKYNLPKRKVSKSSAPCFSIPARIFKTKIFKINGFNFRF